MPTPLNGRVTHVVDGDTLDVIVQEQSHPCANPRHRCTRTCTTIRPSLQQSHSSQFGCGEAAQIDGNKHDRMARMLAYVRCNGTDAGAEQVRRGMTWNFVRYTPADSPLYAIEQEARAARRGLWATLQPVPPWEWRHR